MGLFSFLSESGKGCTATISSDQFVVEVTNSLPPLISAYLYIFSVFSTAREIYPVWASICVISGAPMFVVHVHVLEV
jgi:hypothetical protein